MKQIFALCALMVGLTACDQSAADLDKLAAQGLIQENAPIQAAAEIVIAAPATKVWALLTDIKDWPKWQRDISQKSIRSDPATGIPFSWSDGGINIHLLESDKRWLADLKHAAES